MVVLLFFANSCELPSSLDLKTLALELFKIPSAMRPVSGKDDYVLPVDQISLKDQEKDIKWTPKFYLIPGTKLGAINFNLGENLVNGLVYFDLNCNISEIKMVTRFEPTSTKGNSMKNKVVTKFVHWKKKGKSGELEIAQRKTSVTHFQQPPETQEAFGSANKTF